MHHITWSVKSKKGPGKGTRKRDHHITWSVWAFSRCSWVPHAALQTRTLLSATDASTCRCTWVGLAKTIYIRCIFGIFSREIAECTVIYGVDIQSWSTLHMRLALLCGSCQRGELRGGWSSNAPCVWDPYFARLELLRGPCTFFLLLNLRHLKCNPSRWQSRYRLHPGCAELIGKNIPKWTDKKQTFLEN